MYRQKLVGDSTYVDIDKIIKFTPEEKKYQSRLAAQKVLGAIMQRPTLLRAHTTLRASDFADTFQQFIFVTIKYIIRDNIGQVHIEDVETYLKEHYPEGHKKFGELNGPHYLNSAIELADPNNFEIYYTELKKWSCLRFFYKAGFIKQVTEFYNPDIMTSELEGENSMEKLAEQRREQSDRFSGYTLQQVNEFILGKYLDVARYFDEEESAEVVKIGGEDALEVYRAWGKGLNKGLDYSSQLLYTITNGIRKKRFSIISAPSGCGKTRMLMSNMCHTFCPEYWDEKKEEWVKNPSGNNISALFISTEQDPRTELEPMIQAYMASVPEDHIKDEKKRLPGETERIEYAIEHSRRFFEDGKESNAGIYITSMPNYTVGSLRRVIEKYRDYYGVEYVFLDYMSNNPELTYEFSMKSHIDKPREDQVLLYLSTALKDMCLELDIAIETATQVSGDVENNAKDHNLIRGAKSIPDKCDLGIILTKISNKEKVQIEKLRGTANTLFGLPEPTHCLSIYKNRAGRYNDVKIWLVIEQDTLRVHDLYVTNKEITDVLRIEKTHTIVGEKDILAFTLSEAKELHDKGLMSDHDFNLILNAQKANPSIMPNTKASKIATEKARNSALKQDQDDEGAVEEVERITQLEDEFMDI